MYQILAPAMAAMASGHFWQNFGLISGFGVICTISSQKQLTLTE